MPTVDAILRIDDAFLNKIAEADKRIVELGETAQRTAQRVNNAFAYTMVDGVQSFINAVKAAKHELAGLTMPSMGSVASTASVTALTSAITPLIAEIGKLNTSFGALTSAGGGTHIVFADASKAILSFRAALTSLGLSMDDANKKMQELINLRTPASPTPARSIAEIDASSRKVIISLAELQKNYNDLSKIMANSDPKTKQWSEAALAIDYTANRLREYSQQQKNAQQGAMSLADSMSRLSSTNLQSMGAHDLQQTISNLKTAMDNISRTSMGGVTAEWQRLNALLQQAQSELQKIRELEKPRTTPTSNSDLITMANDTRFYAQSLSELKKLQDDLYKAISRMPRTPVDPAMQAELKQLRDGYKAVTKEIADFEKTLKEVKMPTGLTARPFTDIVNAATTAYVPLEQLKVDLKAVQAELAKMSMADQRTFNPALFQQLSQSAQDLANHIAYLNREQKGLNATMQGNAAMGRLAAEGFDGIKRSILSVDTPIKQLERDLSDLRTIFRNTSPNDAQYLKYAQAIRIVEERVRRLREAEKSGATRNIGISELIRDANKAGASLQQLMAVQQRMKNELSKMNPNTQDWARLNAEYQKLIAKTDEIRKKMGDLQQSAKKGGLSFQQLGQYIALAFSVQSIQGFLKKMVEVHAQMELQRVALRALLQDKEKADQIYNSVTQMALRSPFSIQQLTTYTKQIAAYRVEADKLVGTTKMLADVSAGLGVDIQRLILAYGQVKSANYLRATEIRQFTEAGLNIAGELSKYLSEVEGRSITVAEVMEMVTKRMVKFEDVEEVFRRITSSGGMFFDMQKKQSETTYGLLQRIQDAYTIMLDEIGKGSQGTINSVLTTIRNLLSQWRAFKEELKYIIGVFGAYKVATLLITTGTNGFMRSTIQAVAGTKLLRIATTELTNNLLYSKVQILAARGAILAFNAVLAAAAIAVTVFIHKLVLANEEAKALAEEISRIESDNKNEANKAAARYEELARTITSTTKTTEERKKALDEINRVYGSYLPKMYREIDGITQMGGAYGEATKAIRLYYAEKQKDDKTQFFEGRYQQNFQKLLADKSNIGFLADYGFNENDVYIVLQKVIERISKENIKNDVLGVKYADLIRDAFSEYGGENLIVSNNDDFLYLGEVLEKLVPQYKAAAEAKKEFIYTGTEKTKQERQASEADYRETLRQKEFYASQKKNIEQLSQLYDIYSKQKQKNDKESKRTLAEIIELYKKLGVDAPEAFDAVVESGLFLNDEMRRVGYEAGTNFINGLQSNLLKSSGFFKNFLEKTQDEVQNYMLTPQKDAINDTLKDVEKDFNASGLFNSIKLTGEATTESIRQEIKGNRDRLKNAVESYKIMIKAGESVEAATKKAFGTDAAGNYIETIDTATNKVDALTTALNRLGFEDKEKKGGGNGENSIWRERLNLLTQIIDSYKKLKKYYGVATADDKTRKAYAETVMKEFAGTAYENIFNWDSLKDSAQIKRLQDLGSIAGEKYGTQFYRAASKIESELSIETQKEALSNLKDLFNDIFSNYDLTKEFADLGMDVNLTYIVGGQPMTLAQIRKSLEQVFSTNNKFHDLGEDAKKAYEEALKKLEQLELKSMIQREKNWAKVTLESMGERAQIMLKTQREINKIMESDDFDDATKSLMKEQLLKKQQQALDKQAWSSFKSSDFYISMFEDMEHHSSQYIDIMIKQLRGLKESLKDLPADQVRAIVKEIEKLENTKEQRNPFSTLINALKGIRKAAIDAKEAEQQLVSLTAQKAEKDQAVTDQELLVENLRNQYEATKGMFGAGSEAAKKAQADYQRAVDTLAQLKKEQDGINEQIGTANGKISVFTQKLDAAQIAFEAIRQFSEQMVSDIGEIINTIDEFANVSQGLKDGFSTFQEIFSGMNEMGSGVLNGIMGYFSGNPMQMAQGIMQTAKGLVKVIGGIAKIGDKKKERQINKLKDRVYELSQAYEQLHKSIERAYAMDDFVLGNRQAKKNLEAQIRSYEQILQLEKDKKKTDKDKVREYEEKLVELKDKLEDLRNEELKALGGFGSDDRLSAAESFASAWLSAYKETGDGLDALSEQWDEYIDNLIVKQASLRIVGKRMKKFFDMVDLALDEKSDEGENLSEKEAAKIAALRKELLDSTNKDLKAFVDALGLTRKGTAKLSDLQMGISNITEEQAAALEAITNSIRFGVYQQLEVLNQIAAILRTQYGGSNNGALLEEVRAIKSLLMRIDSRFNSITATKSGVGSYLKVG